LLEADKSEASIFAFLKFNVLDLTELLEKVSKVISSPLAWEVLDVQVASLFRSLVSQSLSLFLELSVRLFHGCSDVKLKFTSHFLSIKTIDSLLGTFWSVLLVDSLRVIVANETKLSDIVFEKFE